MIMPGIISFDGRSTEPSIECPLMPPLKARTTPPDPLQQAESLMRAALTKDNFRVFVFGPYLEHGTAVTQPTDKISGYDSLVEHARYLRYAAAEALKADMFPVHFGETKEVLELWGKQLTSGIDPANAEIQHAQRVCGAVVVFPSSIGSFCELSLFAAIEELAKKTIAIVHEAHKNDESFFRKGLLRILRQEHGSVEYSDYSDTAGCIKTACEFVSDRYMKTVRDGDLVERGMVKKLELEHFIVKRPC
jgi:hypothetical protein